MAIETVVITVQDDEVVPGLVDGVVVRVYDATGTTLITSGTTGDVLTGKIEFSLDGDDPAITYQLRFYINGGAIASPQYIEVYSPPASAPTGANNFLITASLFTLPPATNSRLCRASGYIWGPNGKPRRGVDISFISCFSPLVVDGIGVLGERVNTRTDENGYVQVDLLRNGTYRALVESHDNVLREVVVPDRSSVNIMHLLFPVVNAVVFDPAGPFSLSVGGTLEIVPELTASDFRVLEGLAGDDVTYTIDDTAIATVSFSGDKLVLRGVAVGSTTLTITRKDDSIVYVPDPGIDGVPIAITVT